MFRRRLSGLKDLANKEGDRNATTTQQDLIQQLSDHGTISTKNLKNSKDQTKQQPTTSKTQTQSSSNIWKKSKQQTSQQANTQSNEKALETLARLGMT